MKKFLTGVRGKQVLVSGLAVLVLVAGYYRWSVDRAGEITPVMSDSLPQEAETAEKTAENEADNSNDYFAKARYERDCARSEATELLKVSAEEGEDGESDDGAVAEKLAKYAKNIEDEAMIENLVIAKGFADCVAFVDDTGVKVVVKTDKLESEGVAQIKDIVIGQTGVKATDIKISDQK